MSKYSGYPQYRYSGIEWLAEVPTQWVVKRLKDIASYNDEALADNTEPDYELEYVDISSVNLIQGITSRESMTFDKAPSRARRKVSDGDTIISTVRTYLKAIAAIRNPPPNMIVSTGFAVVRPKESIDPDYMGYLLQSEGFVGSVVANSVGVSYPAINASDLARLPVVVPPLLEQQAITRFLDYKTEQLDALIAKRERLLEKLAEKRTALINRVVTKGLDSSPPMREIPVGWMTVRLRFLLAESLANGLFKKKESWGSGTRIVNVVDVYTKNDIIDELSLERVECNDQEGRQYSAENGDFFFVRSSLKLEGIGKSAVVLEPQEPVVFECHLVRGRPDLERVYPKFLNYCLNSHIVREGLISVANQVTMTTIDQNKFKDIPIVFPGLGEQVAIVSYLDRTISDFERTEKNIEDAIRKLKEYRSALITNAVTGQIDVRDVFVKRILDQRD